MMRISAYFSIKRSGHITRGHFQLAKINKKRRATPVFGVKVKSREKKSRQKLQEL